jgi:hypothetical protein
MPGSAARPRGHAGGARRLDSRQPSAEDAPSVGLNPGELPRDAIYCSLRTGNTGVGVYTLPSRSMTGFYASPATSAVAAFPLHVPIRSETCFGH